MGNASGKHWFNNGLIEKYSFECPEGWEKGRLKKISEAASKRMKENNPMHNLSIEQRKERAEKIHQYNLNKTDEQKQHKSKAISERKKGKPRTTTVWNKGKKGVQVAWNRGLSQTEENKKKISETRKNKSEEEKLIISEKLSLSLKGREPWNKGKHLSISLHTPNKTELLELCLSNDFPQTLLSKKSILNNYNYLKNNSLSPYNNTCCKLIQHFHPSLWKANIKNHLSPYNAWYDINCLEKSIDNRLRYKGNNLSLFDIRSGFSIGKIAPKVSIFRPSLAKYIIEKYLNEFNEIFDPCSGYSGRLLGAVSLNKKYIGQDINKVTVNESNNLIREVELNNCEVKNKNSLATKGTYECLFTCPPYLDKENWNKSIEDLSCDEWISICLKNYNCKKYIFVVDDTKLYKDYIKEELVNKSYISSSKEYIIVIE